MLRLAARCCPQVATRKRLCAVALRKLPFRAVCALALCASCSEQVWHVNLRKRSAQVASCKLPCAICVRKLLFAISLQVVLRMFFVGDCHALPKCPLHVALLQNVCKLLFEKLLFGFFCVIIIVFFARFFSQQLSVGGQVCGIRRA